MCLRRSLARAYKLHVHDFCHVGTFGGLPPPIPISWLRYCCQLSLTRRVVKWRWPIRPPTRHTKSPPAYTTDMVLQIVSIRYFTTMYELYTLPDICKIPSKSTQTMRAKTDMMIQLQQCIQLTINNKRRNITKTQVYWAQSTNFQHSVMHSPTCCIWNTEE